MIKRTIWICVICFITHIQILFGQTYPVGQSEDSIILDNLYCLQSNELTFYIYKPTTYDSINSPILFGINGIGGDGTSTISHLMDIAERRHALIIAPNIGTSSGIRELEAMFAYGDTISGCGVILPATIFF